MPQGLGDRKMKLKWRDKLQTWGDLTVTQLMDERDIHMLTNAQYASAEGNFCEEQGELYKHSLWQTDRHKGCVDVGD